MDVQYDTDRQVVDHQINKLKSDLKLINDFLNTDLRISKIKNSEGVQHETIENIEEQEDKKMYYEWAERQAQS